MDMLARQIRLSQGYSTPAISRFSHGKWNITVSNHVLDLPSHLERQPSQLCKIVGQVSLEPWEEERFFATANPLVKKKRISQ